MIKVLKNLPNLIPDFDFDIKSDQTYTNCQIDDSTYSIVEDWIKSLGLVIGHFSALVCAPVGGLPLHIDYKGHVDFPKINWVYGSGKVRFFKTDTIPSVMLKTDLNLPYQCFDSYENSTLIEEYQGSGTILINAAIPHDVVDVTDYRHCFSLTPLKRRGRLLTWEEAVEIFQ
jgi:hypothetical protein